MPVYYDSQKKSYSLTERIGSGGEGTVYVCPNDFGLVAKIYHEAISDEKAEKLRWMAVHKNDNLLKVAAWIVDTLHDAPDGKVVGFLMPNVKAKEIHELYSLKSRRVYFPHATWKFLIHTAANLARAFYNLHKNQHIMGDINHGNCVVLADGTVKLIDCDSYSISTGDFRYPCEVGVATHLAPELQRVNLRGVEREAKHDNFGIAVIIFQLLFLGRHPFSGNFLGSEDKSLEDCIREHRFAYGEGAKDRWVKQPPGTLPLSAASPRVALMFERAFLTEDRPEPQEWIEALEDLSHNLKQCTVHPGHSFFDGLKDCPFCEIENQTGLMLFPFTSEKSNGDGEEHFNIFTVENLIASLNIPSNLPMIRPQTNTLGLIPAPEIATEKSAHLLRIGKFAVAQFLMILVLTAIFGLGFAFMWGVIVLIFSLVYVSNAHQSIRENADYDLESANKELTKLEDAWTVAGGQAQLEDNLNLIRKKVSEYEQFQHTSREQMKHLREEVFQYKLNLYLSDFKITEAKVSGTVRGKLIKLKSFGVKTAADIESKRLRSLPVVDNLIAQDLLDWRKNLERDFKYDLQEELPEAERQKFTGVLSEKRRHIEKEIEGLFVGLRSGAALVRQKQQHLTAKADELAVKIQQAKKNIEAVGSNGLGVGILVATTFVTLGVASFVTSANPNFNSNKDINGGSATARPPVLAPPAFDDPKNSPLPDSLTDDQIAAMSNSSKIEMANKLYDLVSRTSPASSNDYQKAEQRLRLAAKLSPADAQILNKLGNILYQQDKLPQALDVFKKALKTDSKSSDAKAFTGMTYLRMDKYQEAVNIFTELTKAVPQSSEWQFNLGLGYKGLKKYAIALEKFKAAQNITPNDTATQNEIDFCNEKLGIKSTTSGNGIGSGSGNGVRSGDGSGTGNGSGNSVGRGAGGSADVPPPPPPRLDSSRSN